MFCIQCLRLYMLSRTLSGLQLQHCEFFFLQTSIDLFCFDFRDSPYVLFQCVVNSVGFVGRSSLLSEYLVGLITGKADNQLDVRQLTAGIGCWSLQEVTLLSEMSMDSMQELYSQFQVYDDRWNEVFMQPALTNDLQKLKVSMCSSRGCIFADRPLANILGGQSRCKYAMFKHADGSILNFLRGHVYAALAKICESVRGLFIW